MVFARLQHRLLAPAQHFRVLAAGAPEAAKRLFVTQSAVSHAVAELEAFIRATGTHGRLTLTTEGRAVLEAPESIFSAMEKGEKKVRRLRAQKTRLLRIGCPFLILQTILTPKLAHFHHHHSEVEVRLTIENWMQLMLDPLLSEHDIGCFRYSFFASRKNFGTLEGRTLSLEDLSRLPMVILRSGNNTSDCLGIRHCGTATAGKRQDRHPVLHRGVYPGGLRGGGLIPEPPLPSGRYTMLYRNEVKLPQTAKNFLGAFRTEPPPILKVASLRPSPARACRPAPAPFSEPA